MAELIIGASIAMGTIIGAYELFVIHRDVQVGARKFGHGIHAFLLSIAFVFTTMNTEFVLSIIPQLQGIPIIGTVLGAQIAVGLIAAIKIHAVSKTLSGGPAITGTTETWFHSILIGGLITGAPYLYPLIEPSLPSWIKF